MRQARITKYARTAGRVNIINGYKQEGLISPIAAPSLFAQRHGLQIEHIVREHRDNELAVALLLRNAKGDAASVSGIITDTLDDHACTRFEDLDFASLRQASTEMYIALEELFEGQALVERRELMRIVA